jgi:formate dehydrogenase iron-sulfur subunit
MAADETIDGEVREIGPHPPSRRTFLKGVAVAAGAASVAATSPPVPRKRPDPNVVELAQEHENDPAMLIDLTRCVGCGRCVTACKAVNDLEWREDQPAKGPDAELASENWSIVRSEGRVGEGLEPRFVKYQCMHCLEPACVSACFVKALQKTDSGAVVYDGNRCVGCRYCQMACPFSVPTFQWDRTFGRISKCDFCVERTSRGEPSACAEACPVGAITFGRRGELLAEAHRRIGAAPYKYVSHVYGETEVGGTSMLYLSDVPFEDLGFRTTLPDTPLPEYTWEITRLIPPVASGIGISLLALYIRHRRDFLEHEDAEAGLPSEVES